MFIMSIDWDPTNTDHTVTLLARLMREQADRLDFSVWSLGPGERIEIRHPTNHRVVGHFRFDEKICDTKLREGQPLEARGDRSVMIAAIGSDGTRPVVWGIGETEETAFADADTQGSYDWRTGGWATCEVPPEIVARIQTGVVDCATLGIAVFWLDGQIIHAEVRSP